MQPPDLPFTFREAGCLYRKFSRLLGFPGNDEPARRGVLVKAADYRIAADGIAFVHVRYLVAVVPEEFMSFHSLTSVQVNVSFRLFCHAHSWHSPLGCCPGIVFPG